MNSTTIGQAVCAISVNEISDIKRALAVIFPSMKTSHRLEFLAQQLSFKSYNAFREALNFLHEMTGGDLRFPIRHQDIKDVSFQECFQAEELSEIQMAEQYGFAYILAAAQAIMKDDHPFVQIEFAGNIREDWSLLSRYDIEIVAQWIRGRTEDMDSHIETSERLQLQVRNFLVVTSPRNQSALLAPSPFVDRARSSLGFSLTQVDSGTPPFKNWTTRKPKFLKDISFEELHKLSRNRALVFFEEEDAIQFFKALPKEARERAPFKCISLRHDLSTATEGVCEKFGHLLSAPNMLIDNPTQIHGITNKFLVSGFQELFELNFHIKVIFERGYKTADEYFRKEYPEVA